MNLCTRIYVYTYIYRGTPNIQGDSGPASSRGLRHTGVECPVPTSHGIRSVHTNRPHSGGGGGHFCGREAPLDTRQGRLVFFKYLFMPFLSTQVTTQPFYDY